MEWKALLNKNEKEKALQKVKSIAECLLQVHQAEDENIGLLAGKSGISLFMFYYAKAMEDNTWANHAYEYLSEVFDFINKGEYSYHTLCNGLGGVAWTVEHLSQNDFLDADTEEILGELDPFLKKAMLVDMQNGNFDFLHGAVGNGVYFLSRPDKEENQEALIQLIDELENQAHKDESGAAKWISTLDHEKGTQGYNLSLSHGIASIIGFLGKVVEAGIYLEKSRPLLERSVQYLLQNIIDPAQHKSYFPSWIQEGESPSGSRLAWCYGDLGVCTALLQSARSCGNKEWEAIALKALKETLKRVDPKEEGVLDAGLCHGAAGNAHIYNRLYHYTQDEAFKKAALHWLEDVYNKATFEDGYAGFKTWHTEKYGGWQPSDGVLEGVAGIGLALLALATDLTPGWDRSLLLS